MAHDSTLKNEDTPTLSTEAPSRAQAYPPRLIALVASIVVLVSVSLYQFHQINGLTHRLEAAERTIGQQPQLGVINFAKTARRWAAADQEFMADALQRVVNAYNQQGYLIIDEKSIVGEVGHFELEVPAPNRMKQLMGNH